MRNKVEQRMRRKLRIRSRVHGTAERPRLTVFRSARHIYAQVVNDDTGSTLLTLGTLSKELRDVVKGLKKRQAAQKVGEAIAKACKEKNIAKVVFDRNGYAYEDNNRVGFLAGAARKAGLGL
ncbi:MAG: 50S ribosomal protein L18 [Deltaproteobacteria bacterium]|nr:50S ribosomal protein L18 [Deltaproteobacteria bacterium]